MAFAISRYSQTQPPLSYRENKFGGLKWWGRVVGFGLGGGEKIAPLGFGHTAHSRQAHRGRRPQQPPTYSPSATSPPCPFPSLVTPMSATDSSLPPQAVTSLEVVGLACDAQPASRPSDVVSHSSRCATLPASRSRAMQTSWARSLLHHQAVRWLTSAAPDLART